MTWHSRSTLLWVAAGILLVGGPLSLSACAGGESVALQVDTITEPDQGTDLPQGECKVGTTRSCYTGSAGCVASGDAFQCTGGCKAGEESCGQDGKWSGSCTGEVLPSDESCNNIDDNCDGRVDEDLSRSCFTGSQGCSKLGVSYSCKGICQPGSEVCVAGQWGACNGQVLPEAQEACDKKDNDCDGDVDEGCQCIPGQTQACYSGDPATKNKGPCKEGQQACDQSGSWGACVGEVVPAAESCNGQDEDCSGTADDGLTAPACSLSQGVCVGAKKSCGGVAGWVDCSAADYQSLSADYESVEASCDNKDNDCDGLVDEGLSRACFSGATGCTMVGSSYQCVGQCQAGTEACSGGSYGSCSGEVLPQVELCNWLDDDCDGAIDEDGACYYSGWGSVSGFPSGAQRVAFVDAKIGVAVGSSGGIWRTTNGGTSWQAVSSPTSSTLRAVAALPSGLVIAVGSGGTIVRSGDRGESFSTVPSGTSYTLYGVTIAYNGSRVMAVGSSGRILRSTDHGLSFATVTSGTSSTLRAVVFRASSTSYALAVGDSGRILRTTSGGTSWTSVASGTTQSLRGVAFWSGTAVVAGASGTVLRSTDSGASFAMVTIPGISGTLHSVVTPGSQTFVVGGATSFYLTVNDGVAFVRRSYGSSSGSFTALTLRSPTALFASASGSAAEGEGPVAYVKHVESDTLQAVAYDNRHGGQTALAVGYGGRILRSGDEGATWTEVHAPTTSTLYGVSVLGTTALAVGTSGTILRSTDSGRNWRPVVSGVTSTLRGVALSLDGSTQVALAVGYSGTVLRSTNGGQSWTKISLSSPYSYRSLYAVSFKDSTAVVCGSSGSILRSTNRGASFSAVSSGVTNSLYGVYLYSSSGTTVAVGSSGTILRSTNGGSSFTKVTSGVTNTLYAVANGLGSHVLVVGSSGTMLYSSNSGSSFTAATGPRLGTLYGAFRNYGSNRMLAVGAATTILRSTNYGATSSLATAPGIALRDVAALPSGKHIAVGYDGFVAVGSGTGASFTFPSTGTESDLWGVGYEPTQQVVTAVGSSGEIIRSTNGGQSWSGATSSNTSTLYGVAGSGSNRFRAVGSSGTLLSSTNGGASFSSITSPTTSTLRRVRCLQNACLAVGSSGRILRSQNGGASFAQINSPVTSTLYDVAYGITSTAVAVGSSAVVLYSEDGGNVWINGSTPTSSVLYGVAALSSQRYLAVDSAGRTLASADGGKTWALHAPPLGKATYALAVSGASGGILVGSEGLVARYTP